jgi:hypothetical protein
MFNDHPVQKLRLFEESKEQGTASIKHCCHKRNCHCYTMLEINVLIYTMSPVLAHVKQKVILVSSLYFVLCYSSVVQDMKQNSEENWSLFWWIIGCTSLSIAIPWLIFQLFGKIHSRCARRNLKDKV